MTGALRRLRKPVLAGAGVGVSATGAGWISELLSGVGVATALRCAPPKGLDAVIVGAVRRLAKPGAVASAAGVETFVAAAKVGFLGPSAAGPFPRVCGAAAAVGCATGGVAGLAATAALPACAGAAGFGAIGATAFTTGFAGSEASAGAGGDVTAAVGAGGAATAGRSTAGAGGAVISMSRRGAGAIGASTFGTGGACGASNGRGSCTGAAAGSGCGMGRAGCGMAGAGGAGCGSGAIAPTTTTAMPSGSTSSPGSSKLSAPAATPKNGSPR